MNHLRSLLGLNTNETIRQLHFLDFHILQEEVSKEAEALANGKILICGDLQSQRGNKDFGLPVMILNKKLQHSFTTEINGSCEDVEVQPDRKSDSRILCDRQQQTNQDLPVLTPTTAWIRV